MHRYVCNAFTWEINKNIYRICLSISIYPLETYLSSLSAFFLFLEAAALVAVCSLLACRSDRSCTWWKRSKHVVFLLPIIFVHKLTKQTEQYIVVFAILASLFFGSLVAQHIIHLGGHLLTFATIPSPASSSPDRATIFSLALSPFFVLQPVLAWT